MIQEYLKEKKELVEKNLKKELQKYEYPYKLSEAMEYGVLNGGKRIRPIIMYIICDLFNENYEKIEKTSVALEFIHCYSLIHDDLPAMDNDTYRRGKLTVHAKYNEAIGVLTGDTLLTEAFGIIGRDENLSAEKKVAIIEKLSKYSGFYGMAGGQFVDMESEGIEGDIERLNYIHSNKTGKLLLASVELPLIALGIRGDKYEKLIEFSKLMGIIFQIKDDILDLEGNFEKMGKESNDEKNKKLTYPKLFGMDESKKMLENYLKKSRDIITEYFNGNQLMLELINFFGNREG